jgi:hypothetical protein
MPEAYQKSVHVNTFTGEKFLPGVTLRVKKSPRGDFYRVKIRITLDMRLQIKYNSINMTEFLSQNKKIVIIASTIVLASVSVVFLFLGN